MDASEGTTKRPRDADEGSVLSDRRPRVQTASQDGSAGAVSAPRSVAASALESGAAVLLNTSDTAVDTPGAADEIASAAYSALAVAARASKAKSNRHVNPEAYESDDDAEIVTEEVAATQAALNAPVHDGEEEDEDDFGAYDVLSTHGATSKQRRKGRAVGGRAAHDDDSSDEEAEAKKKQQAAGTATGDESKPAADDDEKDAAFDSAEDESDDDEHRGKASASKHVVHVRGEQAASTADEAATATDAATDAAAAAAAGGGGTSGVVNGSSRRVRWSHGATGSDGIVRVEGGIIVEAFNLDSERQQGHFEENFNYVRHDDDHADEDEWMKGIRLAGGVSKSQQFVANNKQPLTAVALPTVRQAASTIISLLQGDETVTRALARLGRVARPPSARELRLQRVTGGRAAQNDRATSSAVADAKAAIGSLTTAAETLLGSGDDSAYDRTAIDVESVAETLWAQGKDQAEEAAASAAAAAQYAADLQKQALADQDAILWVYGVDGTQQGPFTSTQMLQWQSAGFFAPTNGTVRCKRARHHKLSASSDDLDADLDDLDEPAVAASSASSSSSSSSSSSASSSSSGGGQQADWEVFGPWQDASQVNFRSFAAKE